MNRPSDDVVATNPPWWRRNFFIQHDKPFAWWWLAAPLALLLLLAAALIGIPNIEDDLTDKTSAALTTDHGAAVLDEIEIDYSGRSATLKGVLPAGLTIADIEARVGALEGVRTVDVDGLSEATVIADPEPETEAEPEEPEPGDTNPIATGLGLSPRATYDGTVITLTGVVLSADEGAELVAAAEAAVGAENVVNDLTVDDGTNATAEADAKVSALAASLAGFGAGITSGSAVLTDDSLDLEANAADEAAAAAFETAVDVSAPGLTSSVGVATAALPESAAVETLQTELDGLAAEVRETVVFSSGGAVLTAEAMTTLDKAAAVIIDIEGPVVEIGGHTDDQGGADGNQALSQSRAQAVALYLAQAGVDPARITAVGYGETKPLADNTTPEGRLENRRVELVASASS